MANVVILSSTLKTSQKIKMAKKILKLVYLK